MHKLSCNKKSRRLFVAEKLSDCGLGNVEGALELDEELRDTPSTMSFSSVKLFSSSNTGLTKPFTDPKNTPKILKILGPTAKNT